MATPIPQNRAPFSLDEILAATGGRCAAMGQHTQVSGVAIDSRAVAESNLFVAIRGETHDGVRYLPQAIANGAYAAMVHPGAACPSGITCIEVEDTTRALGDLAAYHRRRWGGAAIAITGSAGKTTTKELTAAALSGIGARVLKTTGNLNNYFGVPMMAFCLTPEQDTAVFEVGTSGRGEIARLGQIVQPDVAVVLLAAIAHTAGIGTLDDVADEKASLWGALGPNGTAIVNADDANLCARLRKDVQTLSFGTAESADVRLVSSLLTLEGTTGKVHVKGHGDLDLQVPLLGHVAAFDAAAALAVVMALRGTSALPAAVHGLSLVQHTAGRMQPKRTPEGSHVIDDSYNANPESAAVSLRALAELAQARGTRSIAVLGDMKELGSESVREHARIGELAVRLGIDVVVGCGVESLQLTSAAARVAAGRLAPHPTRVVHVMEPMDAVAIVRSLWRAGDVALVKGSRSMAMERVVAALCAEGAGRA